MLQPRRAQHADQPGGLGQGADVLSRITAHMSRISGPARGSPRDWPLRPQRHTKTARSRLQPITGAHIIGARCPLTPGCRALPVTSARQTWRTPASAPNCNPVPIEVTEPLIRPDGRTDRTPFGDVDRRSVPGRRIGAANRRPERANRTPLHGAVGRAGAHCPWPPQALTDRDRSTDPRPLGML
jgi:hypothetical protein